jgi:hypothetical protein
MVTFPLDDNRECFCTIRDFSLKNRDCTSRPPSASRRRRKPARTPEQPSSGPRAGTVHGGPIGRRQISTGVSIVLSSSVAGRGQDRADPSRRASVGVVEGLTQALAAKLEPVYASTLSPWAWSRHGFGVRSLRRRRCCRRPSRRAEPVRLPDCVVSVARIERYAVCRTRR